jgi:hypothetical protein
MTTEIPKLGCVNYDQERRKPPTDIAAYIDWILRGGRFDVHPPNEDGKANCIIRWMMETPSGWVGSWDKAALEQFVKPADDSAAYHGWVLREVLFDNGEPVGHREPQPTRKWVGLTDDEVSALWEVWRASLPRYAGFARGLEAKLKEKNT